MDWKIVMPFYERWSESAEYMSQSALENEIYDECVARISEVIGKETLHDISDDIVNLANEAECEGFSNGFRYGIMFMTGVLKGGATA